MSCYGFTPMVLPPGYDYYAMFHGTDERIPLSALESGVLVMDRFLATTAGSYPSTQQVTTRYTNSR
jgi:acetylornithine deacetylase/succinyl-diaminopimelate desuccinylase-like protein